MTYFYSFSAPYFLFFHSIREALHDSESKIICIHLILGHDVTPPVHPLKQAVPLL